MASRFSVLLVLLVSLRAGAEAGGAVAGDVQLVRLSVGSKVDGWEDVVVYLEDAPAAGKLPEGPFVVTQKDKAFHPEELVVPVGAKVEFPNLDAIFHNVFSTSQGNQFDLGLYKNGDSKSVVFNKPGVVPIFCNIHPLMISYILVVTNPFFAHPDGNGRFRLADVPPGRYHLVAWMPYGASAREEVTVEAGKTAEQHLILRERSGAQRHPKKDGKPYGAY